MSEPELASILERNPLIHIHAGHSVNQQTPKEISPSALSENSQKINKYRNVKVYIYADGIAATSKTLSGHGKTTETYDSQKEYDRWCDLKMLQSHGMITGLNKQVPLEIQNAFTYQGKRVRAIVYKADFVYTQNGVYVVEDVKPYDELIQRYRVTDVFALKWKLLMARYPAYSFRLY